MNDWVDTVIHPVSDSFGSRLYEAYDLWANLGVNFWLKSEWFDYFFSSSNPSGNGVKSDFAAKQVSGFVGFKILESISVVISTQGMYDTQSFLKIKAYRCWSFSGSIWYYSVYSLLKGLKA